MVITVHILASLSVLQCLVNANIRDASELNCNFDIPCHWFNGTTGLEDDLNWRPAVALDGSVWRQGVGSAILAASGQQCFSKPPFIERQAKSKTVITSTCADGSPFTMVFSDESQNDIYTYAQAQANGELAGLVSAIVPGQRGVGNLTFSYWKSRSGPLLYVCGRQPPSFPNNVNCSWHVTSNENAGGPYWRTETVSIPPNLEPFEIILIAQFRDAGDVIALDNIAYQADVLPPKEERQRPLPIPITRNTVVVPEGAQPRRPFSIGGVLGGDFLQPVPQQAPEVSFIDPLGEHNGDLLLRGVLGEKVTGRENPSRPILNRNTATTIAEQQPLVTDAGQQEIDSLTTAPSPNTPRSRITDCPAVECTFKDNSCEYGSVVTNSRQWERAEGRVGNRVTGINSDSNGDDGFVYVAGNSDPSEVNVTLESPIFRQADKAILIYNYHLSGAAGKLQVCDKQQNVCLWTRENTAQNFNATMRKWRTAEVKFEPGWHQIQFVASNLPPNYNIGIDNIRFVDREKKSQVACRS